MYCFSLVFTIWKKYHTKKAVLAFEIGLLFCQQSFLPSRCSISISESDFGCISWLQSKNGAKNVFCYLLTPKESFSKVAYKSCEWINENSPASLLCDRKMSSKYFYGKYPPSTYVVYVRLYVNVLYSIVPFLCNMCKKVNQL